MRELGLTAPEEVVAAVFASFDPDSDGSIVFTELHQLLIKSVREHPKLEPLELKALNSYSLRRQSLSKKDANLLADAIKSPADVCGQIRAALKKRLVRVLDLFRQFDDDGNGTIDGREFMKAMYELGLEASEGDVAAVFASFDPNSDGVIEYHEMHELLVRSEQSHPDLAPLDVRAVNAIKLRKQRIESANANLFQGDFSLESDSLDSFPQQLRAALHRRLARTIDLFRQLDDDSNGCIDFGEFAKGVSELGLDNVPREVVRTVFRLFDEDGDGLIEYEELDRIIRKSKRTHPRISNFSHHVQHSPHHSAGVLDDEDDPDASMAGYGNLYARERYAGLQSSTEGRPGTAPAGLQFAVHDAPWIGSSAAGGEQPSSSAFNVFEHERGGFGVGSVGGSGGRLAVGRMRPATAHAHRNAAPSAAPVKRSHWGAVRNAQHRQHFPNQQLMKVLRALPKPLPFSEVRVYPTPPVDVSQAQSGHVNGSASQPAPSAATTNMSAASSFSAWELLSGGVAPRHFDFAFGHYRATGTLAIIAHPLTGRAAQHVSSRRLEGSSLAAAASGLGGPHSARKMRSVGEGMGGGGLQEEARRRKSLLDTARVCNLPLHRRLHEAGCSLLVYEPHGLGAAPGAPGVLEEAEAKLRAILDYAAMHPIFKYCQIILLTQGVGASVALSAASRSPSLLHDRVRALSVCQPAELNDCDLIADCVAPLANDAAARRIRMLVTEPGEVAASADGDATPAVLTGISAPIRKNETVAAAAAVGKGTLSEASIITEGGEAAGSRAHGTVAQRLHSAWRAAGGCSKLRGVWGYPYYGRSRRFDGSRYFGDEPNDLLEVVSACAAGGTRMRDLWVEEKLAMTEGEEGSEEDREGQDDVEQAMD